MTGQPTFNLVDASLVDRRGHHGEWAFGIAGALAAAGARVRVCCHREAEPALVAALSERFEVLPIFAPNPYDGMRKPAGRPGSPAALDLRKWYREATRDLARAFRALPPADADLVPTLTPVMLQAWAVAGRGVRLHGCIHHEVGRTPVIAKGPWRSAVSAARAAGAEFRLAATTSELRAQFLEVLEALVDDIAVMPVAHDGLRSPAPKPALRRAGFFGRQDAKAKGGRERFATVGRALVDRGIEVVLQDSSGMTGRAQFPFPVTQLGFVDDFAAALRECDLVLAAYDAAAYRRMGSGVVWEAVASGVPVIAPADTAPGNFIVATGAGVVFDAGDDASIVAAIDAARARYAGIALAAHEASTGWLSRHGFAKFAEAFVDGLLPARAVTVAPAAPAASTTPGARDAAPDAPNSRTVPWPAWAPSRTAGGMKVAVITPCHGEPDDVLARCVESVRAQTHRCTHIVIGDGVRRALPARDDLLHLSLPRGVADFGDTPRGVGSVYAAGLGFDAIAYLDADNWFHPRHVESLVELAQRSGAAIVTSRRALHHVDDGRVLAECGMSDGEKFSDTNCLLVTRAAFALLPVWALMDRRVHAIDDRVFWYHVLKSGLPRAHTGRPTIAYLATHAPIYRDLGLPVPAAAKEPGKVREAIAAWASMGLPSMKLVARYRRMRVNPEATPIGATPVSAEARR